MSDASGMYCHACHHQWRREQAGALECPACRSASTEIITPENDPIQFHSRPAPPTAASPIPASSGAPLADAAPAESQDQEMRDAPTNNHQQSNSQQSGGNTTNAGHGSQPQIVFLFPPVTFTTTIIVPIQGPSPSPTQHASGATSNQTPAPVPEPAPGPADRSSAEPRNSPFSFFGMNFFMPQRTSSQESPAAPPPTEANSPPSETRAPTVPQPAAVSESADPATTSGAERNRDHVPLLANLGNLLGLFNPLYIPQGAHPEGETPQAVDHRLLSLLHILAASSVRGDAVYTDQDFERILGRLWENSQPRGAPPASQAAIDALTIQEVDEKMLGVEGGARCVVCVDDMTLGEKATTLPCGHFFHGECVVPWLKVHNTCPTCRGPVESEPKAGKGATFDMASQTTGVDHQRQQQQQDTA